MNLAWLPLIGVVVPGMNPPIQQSVAQPGAPPAAALPRIALEDRSPIDMRLFQAAGSAGVPIAVRIHAMSVVGDDPDLDGKLTSYRRAGVPVWLTVSMPASAQDAERWRQRLSGLLERYRDSIAILEVAIDRRQAQLGAFAVKLAATEARSARPAIRVAIGGTLADDPVALPDVYTAELAPYIDLLVVSDAAAGDVESWLELIDPDAALAVTDVTDGAGPEQPGRRLVDVVLQDSVPM